MIRSGADTRTGTSGLLRVLNFRIGDRRLLQDRLLFSGRILVGISAVLLNLFEAFHKAVNLVLRNLFVLNIRDAACRPPRFSKLGHQAPGRGRDPNT